MLAWEQMFLSGQRLWREAAVDGARLTRINTGRRKNSNTGGDVDFDRGTLDFLTEGNGDLGSGERHCSTH